MKALSFQQPYAWLAATGLKAVDNRPKRTNTRGRIYIHASLLPYGRSERGVSAMLESVHRALVATGHAEAYHKVVQLLAKRKVDTKQYFGAIIGTVEITDCVIAKDALPTQARPWFTGPYGYVLDKPMLWPHPVLWRGQLGFFDVEDVRVHAQRLFACGGVELQKALSGSNPVAKEIHADD